MEKIYAEYGKASVALEIAQGRFNEIKKALVEALNKAKEQTNGGNQDQEPEAAV
jgi:hypothetical protein